MGIKNLNKIIEEHAPNSIHKITNHHLNNKIIAIDTNIFLYKYVTAIRNTGDDLKTSSGKSTSHIYGIMLKIIKMLKLNIIPILIFDNKPSELKNKVILDRLDIKKKAILKLNDNNEISDHNRISLFKQSTSISHEEILEVKEIAELFGIPTIIAKEESDSQCAYLSIMKMVDYVASEDMDLLVFGSKKMIKNFLKKDMYYISLDDILDSSNLTIDEFIDLGILLGCDYSDTIKGIGMKKSWDLIKKYGSIENIISNNINIKNNKYKLPSNFRYIEARNYFKNLVYNSISNEYLKLKEPKINIIKKILIEKYEFNKNKIDILFDFFSNDVFND